MNDIKLTSDNIGIEAVNKLRKKLLDDFLTAFPIDKLQDMTLEQYTNLKKEDSFCYWLEYRTYELGSILGGSSSKFGIYKYPNKPKDEAPKITSNENRPTPYRYALCRYQTVRFPQGNHRLNVS